jgi:hypothetical protein
MLREGNPMSGGRIAVAIALCGIATVIAVRVVIPIVANLFGGIGVVIPLPPAFVRAYPRSAMAIFFVGGPVLILALIASAFYVVRR